LRRPGGRLLAIDGLWWLEPIERKRAQPETDVQRKHRQHYTDQVEAALPLRRATSIEPILEMVRAAGFDDVDVVRLEEIAAVEREVLPPSDREIQARYVLRGMRKA
jgi:hypothetical protein